VLAEPSELPAGSAKLVLCQDCLRLPHHTCCVVLHPPAWHLLPETLPQCLIQQCYAVFRLALAGCQPNVLANGIRRPTGKDSQG